MSIVEAVKNFIDPKAERRRLVELVARKPELAQRQLANEAALQKALTSPISPAELADAKARHYTESRALHKLEWSILDAERKLRATAEIGAEEREAILWREAYNLLLGFWKQKITQASVQKRTLERNVEAAKKDCTTATRKAALTAAEADLEQYIADVIEPLEDQLAYWKELYAENEEKLADFDKLKLTQV